MFQTRIYGVYDFLIPKYLTDIEKCKIWKNFRKEKYKKTFQKIQIK